MLSWHVGQLYKNRQELRDAGLHLPLMAGISCPDKIFAESIVLSGGYEDDEDLGDVIIYTGEGGRDANSGKQTSDQQMTKGNLALRLSMTSGRPVRVVRGASHKSPHSPSAGYRYDGAFRVTDCWHDKGRAGFIIYRFRLEKVSDEIADIADATFSKKGPAPRHDVFTQRIIRDTRESIEVKRLYDYTCQVCSTRIDTHDAPYAEGAHIRPLGRPHNGPDNRENLLCLCPNDHIRFDYGSFTISDDFSLVGLNGNLQLNPKHHINPQHIRYHREHYYLMECRGA